MCLTEIMDFVHRGTCGEGWCYIASFDIAGASDTVPHRRPVQSLREMGVDTHSRRIVRNWLGSRTFQVRLSTWGGAIYSHQYPISMGLPQGGVLPPLLWLTFFISALERTQKIKRNYPLTRVVRKKVLFVGDLTMMISADTQDELREAAVLYVGLLKGVLQDMALELNESKCKNIILDPEILQEGVFRRSPRAP